MKITKTYKWLVFAMLISLTLVSISGYFYKRSPQKAVALNEFQSELIKKEKYANATLNSIKSVLIHSSIDSLNSYHFPENDISYYIFENNNLIFWSDNHINIDKLDISDSINWNFQELTNAYCISKSLTVDSREIVAIITLKYNYPYENEHLNNEFSKGFDLSKGIEIKKGSSNDQLAVFDSEKQYLFSLDSSNNYAYSYFWGIAGYSLSVVFLILFFILLANSHQLLGKNQLSIREFSIISLIVATFTGLSLYFNIPTLLYWNNIFTTFEYSSNPFLASINHLTIATFFFLSVNYLFYFHTKIEQIEKHWQIILLQLMFTSYFWLVYDVLNGLVLHSSIQLNILNFKDITFASLWLHFLLFWWGAGLTLLFYKTHSKIKAELSTSQLIINEIIIATGIFTLAAFFYTENAIKITVSYVIITTIYYLTYLFAKRKNAYSLSALWAFVYISFFIINSVLINQTKLSNKFRTLAENIYINGNTENDRMAEIMLEELDLQIINDKKLIKLSTYSDSILRVNAYINENYLRGFWNKYDMRLNVALANSELQFQYTDFIERAGTRLKDTHFYSVPASYNSMSYLGEFRTKSIEGDSLYLFMEFYPRKNFKSYSFPNLLMTTAPDIQSQLKIAVAKYADNKLIYASGKTEFPGNNNWIPAKKKAIFFSLNYQNKTYYIYNHDSTNQIVITELNPHKPAVYIMYFTYTLLTFVTLSWIIIWFYNQRRRKTKFHIGLTTKFQYAFVILLIISFLGIFYVSVDFIQQKYQDEQILHLENKKNYIQKALQDRYYWIQDLSTVSQQGLNFDLQELSYMYQTDIHVFDNRGVLVGSSQPLIFNKNLISKQISPTPFFTGNSNINQEEHIGKLNYLTGYTDMYNGDYLQIGYIAIPQFLSQEEIRAEIEGFLAVIIHIYLIIIILAIVLSIFIGRQLSAPLKMIENKLKQMRFGHRNEKIDYQLNDEIGQLVTQYNRTIDELEKSAKLLAQSERESAWKTMARQIAHEINNPLTPMKLTIQQLQRTKKMGDERFDDYFEKSTLTLIEQIDNLSRIAGTFSNFARMPEAQFVRVDVAAKLYSVVQLFANNHEQTELKFEGARSEVFVLADAEQLTQVFNNLLKNALQAIPGERQGLIIVKNYIVENNFIIEITDNGIGINEEIADKLFTPNFTTKSTGMGLGLTITKNIVEITGGSIKFNSKINSGTTFCITLPLDQL